MPPEERAGLDLSSLEVAFDGAEPVRAETLDGFARAFAPCGLRREALRPCYGLAEATLLVTAAGAAEAPAAARPAEGAGEPPRVGCGRPAPATEVRIVEPRARRPCPPGREGEIWIAGPGVARGYWRRAGETERVFGARVSGEDSEGGGPWLRTGDLGFVDAAGELYVTGRIKDLVILRGRNLHPQDLEAAAAAAHPALREGAAAAFSVDAGGEERLVVAVEIERARRADAGAAAAAVRRALVEAHGVAAHEVVIVPPGAVPRTTSGKVRRSAAREEYLAGRLPRVGVDGDGPAAAEPAAGADAARDRAHAAAEPGRISGGGLPAAAERLAALAAEVAGLPLAEIAAPLHLDSLQAVELAHRARRDLGLELAVSRLLAGEAPLSLAAGGPAAAAEPELAPVAMPPGSHHPLSAGQRALWLLERLDPGNAGLELAFAARVSEPGGGAPGRVPHPARLAAAWRELIARHPALRASFPAGGEPVQAIAGGAPLDLEIADAARWSAGELKRRLADAAGAPFDLERGPLVRLRLFTGGPAAPAVMAVAVHHVAADLASLDLLAEELALLLAGRPLPPPPAATYAAFARWQEELLAGPRGAELAAWWRHELAGAPESLGLAVETPVEAAVEPPAGRSSGPASPPRGGDSGAGRRRGGSVAVELAPETAPAVAARARAIGTTPFAVLLAAFQALLSRVAGCREPVVGIPAAGRPRAELDAVVGHFVNLLPVRADLRADPAFADLAAAAGRRLAGALDHQDFPFPRLVEELAPRRIGGRQPLVEAGFAFEQPRRAEGAGRAGGGALVVGAAGGRLELGGLILEPLPLPGRPPQLDLVLYVAEDAAGYSAALRYAAGRFDAATAERLARGWSALLAGALERPAERVSRLPLLTAAERRQLAGAEGPAAPAPPSLPAAFAAWTARAPDAAAVVWRDRRGRPAVLTYGALAARAGRLACELRGRGVGAETAVGVVCARSPERVTAIVAVLAAGGCFVALEPGEPPERLGRLLAGAGARLAIADDEGARRLAGGGVELLRPDAGARPPLPPSGPAHPEAAAYVVFTSGSTGEPKGVVVPHRAIAALAAAASADLGLGPGSRQLHFAPLSFDISVAEVLMPLACGAAVCLAGPGARRSGRRLAEEIEALAATDLILTPSVLGLIEPGAEPPSLATLCVGGEVCPPPLAARWAPGRVLVNAYGPAEATVFATLRRCPAGEPDRMRDLGEPIAGGRLRLLDRGLEPVPPGAAGEIHLGGAGLARGYAGRPAATAERFRPDPWASAPGERLYATGDRARRLPGGGAAFLGRTDRQLKVRGVRIEPAEVEAALGRHPAVVAAAVDGRGERLVAWLAARPGEALPPPGELRRWASERLPPHLVPDLWATVARLPLTPNGKLDRDALECPPPPAAGPRPRSELERAIAALWSEELGIAEIAAGASFFDLGGHSLALARIHPRLCAALGREIPLGDLFSHATVAGLAAHLEPRLTSVRAGELESATTAVTAPAGEPAPAAARRRAALAARRRASLAARRAAE